jgi:transcriptional regulator with XRE-family HTH domain
MTEVQLIGLLKARRYALRMSQLALDDRCGFTNGQIAKYESGQRIPQLFHLLCWIEALGLSLSLSSASSDTSGGRRRRTRYNTKEINRHGQIAA